MRKSIIVKINLSVLATFVILLVLGIASSAENEAYSAGSDVQRLEYELYDMERRLREAERDIRSF